MIRNTIAAVLAAASIVATGAIASAANTITLYQGAEIHGQMNSTIGSGTANVGDRFTADVVPPYPSGNYAFQGATLTGTVTSVRRAGQGTKPQLGVEFNYLRLNDGTVVNINASMTQATQKVNNTENGAKVAGGALGGMLIGNAIGKTIFGAGGGGLVGAIGGGILASNNKTNFTIPTGSGITATLNQDVYIRRQSGH